jgi:glycosyltransferase involved in cell wall biosynthesis
MTVAPRGVASDRPLVSIVTPLYNGEDHLEECIESVLRQTYSNWDYTIVNNCSKDRSLQIAEKYAARDPRIRIHNNTAFVRVIENFNNAFRQASPESKYCKVVAADDFLFPECLEKMVALAEANPSVAIVGSYMIEGKRATPDGLPFPQTVVSGRAICRRHLLGGPYIFGTPTTVLFRSDIVRSRHAFFNEANLHADDEACFEFLEDADYGFVHQILTFRRVQEGSMTAFSERYNTYSAGLLHLLVHYGPKYLTAEELSRRIPDVLHGYYRFLARNLLSRRDREFWAYHRTKLADLGFPLSRTRLAAATAALAAELLANPKQTLDRARQRAATAADHRAKLAAHS